MPPELRAALATGGASLLTQGNAIGLAMIALAIAATSDESDSE